MAGTEKHQYEGVVTETAGRRHFSGRRAPYQRQAGECGLDSFEHRRMIVFDPGHQNAGLGRAAAELQMTLANEVRCCPACIDIFGLADDNLHVNISRHFEHANRLR